VTHTESVRLAIFIASYVLIAFPRLAGLRLTRPAAALVGAGAMVTVGRLPLREAYAGIDLDVLTFLLGVLIVAAYLEVGGFFEWTAGHVVARARSARALLFAVIMITGVMSAFFMNDTLCVVMTPLVIAAVTPLRLPPLPFLVAVAMASNVGSTMAITGNPQNMLIGLSSGIPFGAFLLRLALPSLGALFIVDALLARRYRAVLALPIPTLGSALRDTVPVAALDRWLVGVALTVFAGMLASWLAGLSLPLVALAGAAALVLLARRDAGEAFARVDWALLLFFAALFVLVRGVQDVPLIRDVTAAAVAHLHGSRWRDATAVSAAMLVLSNLVSNVPAVLLWRPVVPMLPHATFVWLVMAMSSTFAGNLSLLGSMANLIVAERAQARGVTVPFTDYLLVGLPVTLLTIAWGIVALVAL
jgi:Na+/H+ antiporter NhaD/arsenite permease-like protein